MFKSDPWKDKTKRFFSQQVESHGRRADSNEPRHPGCGFDGRSFGGAIDPSLEGRCRDLTASLQAWEPPD
jgi:hypothetical protein